MHGHANPCLTPARAPLHPTPLQAAEAKLAESADAKKRAAGEAGKEEEEEEDDLYVYLPPGSSMRDPLPNSLSDPLDNRRVRGWGGVGWVWMWFDRVGGLFLSEYRWVVVRGLMGQRQRH